MGNKAKYVSILVIPDNGSGPTKFRLRYSLYRVLRVLIPALCGLMVISLFFWGKVGQLYRENARLRTENAKVRELAAELEQIRSIDRQLREMTGANLKLASAVTQAAYPVADSLNNNSPTKRRDIPSIWPTEGRVSSEFGEYRGLIGKRHEGIDIAAATGTPVRATADGKVLFAGWTDDLGNLIIIKHGNRYFTRYGHNKKIFVKEGQLVKKGQVIATVGSSGHSTAPHLHYEVWEDARPVNPRRFLPKKE